MANPAAVDIFREDDARAGAGEPAVLDLVHLSRQTFGDHALEIELLTLFERQAAQLSARLGGARAPGDAGARMELAHMLKGSARSVGAFAVATLLAGLALVTLGAKSFLEWRYGDDLARAHRH